MDGGALPATARTALADALRLMHKVGRCTMFADDLAAAAEAGRWPHHCCCCSGSVLTPVLPCSEAAASLERTHADAAAAAVSKDGGSSSPSASPTAAGAHNPLAALLGYRCDQHAACKKRMYIATLQLMPAHAMQQLLPQ